MSTPKRIEALNSKDEDEISDEALWLHVRGNLNFDETSFVLGLRSGWM